MNESPGTRVGDALRGHDELHVVEVTTHLLQVCRTLASALDQALQRRHKDLLPYGPYLARVEALVPDAQTTLDPEYLDRAELEALAELLDAATGHEDLALRARDAATILDDRRGAHFFAWFSRRQLRCVSDSPLPVSPGDVVVEEMGTARGLPPPPDDAEVLPSLGVPLDGTRRLRLCPAALGKLSVVLDTRYDGVVDALFSGDRIAAPGPEVTWAAVVPTCDVFADLTYDPIDDADPPGFYRVRPREPGAAQYRARLRKGLELAVARHASIVVVPELSTDAVAEAELDQWFAATRSVSLVIAGSRHLDGTGEPRRNRARILMRGAPHDDLLIHDKFSYFSIVIEDNGVQRTEVIERPNVVTIIAGRRWSFAPLICKDFMEPTARRVLIELRVRAILVASMSPKTDLYVTDARAVSQDGQSLVFVSNIPHGPQDHTAIFAQPRWGTPPECLVQNAHGVVATIQTSGKEFQVVAIP